MNFFASRVDELKPSSTLLISSKATKMKQEGIDVINLSVGEPDFEMPLEAAEGAIKAVKEGKTKYTNVDGIPALKKAVQAKFKEENNLDYDLDEIIITCGAKQAIFNAFMASLNKEDEVIIPAPYWVSYVEIVNLFEGKCKIIETSFNENFKLTPEKLESAITNKTKWFILNSPSNPTGEVYSPKELKLLADIVIKYPHVYILSDDIYEHLIFDKLSFNNILNVEPSLKERVLVINGVSKAYSMTGLRIGYAAIKNKPFIKMLSALRSQSTSNPASISQEAALFALRDSSHFLQTSKIKMEARRDLICQKFKEIAGIELLKPQGAFYLFFSVKSFLGKKTQQGTILGSSLEIADYLLMEGKVALVPGEAFGASGFIRLSYALKEETLILAFERVKDALNKLI